MGFLELLTTTLLQLSPNVLSVQKLRLELAGQCKGHRQERLAQPVILLTTTLLQLSPNVLSVQNLQLQLAGQCKGHLQERLAQLFS
jgi:hypothetical protein